MQLNKPLGPGRHVQKMSWHARHAVTLTTLHMTMSEWIVRWVGATDALSRACFRINTPSNYREASSCKISMEELKVLGPQECSPPLNALLLMTRVDELIIMMTRSWVLHVTPPESSAINSYWLVGSNRRVRPCWMCVLRHQDSSEGKKASMCTHNSQLTS